MYVSQKVAVILVDSVIEFSALLIFFIVVHACLAVVIHLSSALALTSVKTPVHVIAIFFYILSQFLELVLCKLAKFCAKRILLHDSGCNLADMFPPVASYLFLGSSIVVVTLQLLRFGKNVWRMRSS